MRRSDWKPHWSYERVDPDRCRAAVHNDYGVGFHQCPHRPKDGGLYCGVHSDEAIARREAKRKEHWDAKDAARKRRWDEARGNERAVAAAKELREALQKIADGHNDPRALAIEVLGEQEAKE